MIFWWTSKSLFPNCSFRGMFLLALLLRLCLLLGKDRRPCWFKCHYWLYYCCSDLCLVPAKSFILTLLRIVGTTDMQDLGYQYARHTLLGQQHLALFFPLLSGWLPSGVLSLWWLWHPGMCELFLTHVFQALHYGDSSWVLWLLCGIGAVKHYWAGIVLDRLRCTHRDLRWINLGVQNTQILKQSGISKMERNFKGLWFQPLFFAQVIRCQSQWYPT